MTRTVRSAAVATLAALAAIAAIQVPAPCSATIGPHLRHPPRRP